MKTNLQFSLVAVLLVVLSTGCAYMHSVTSSTSPVIDANGKTNWVTQSTKATAYALFDSNASLTKFNNRSSGIDSTNRYAFSPGTYAAGINESASSTNLAAIIQALATGVVNGLK